MLGSCLLCSRRRNLLRSIWSGVNVSMIKNFCKLLQGRRFTESCSYWSYCIHVYSRQRKQQILSGNLHKVLNHGLITARTISIKPVQIQPLPKNYSHAEIITEAISSLKERSGSSQYTCEFIEEKHQQLPSKFKKPLLPNFKKSERS